MKNMNSFVICERDGGAYKINPNDVWFPCPDSNGEIRGELKHVGPWQIPVSYKALAISGKTWDGEPMRVYGLRTLTNVRESGHDLEGKVSLHGKRYRGFTTSVLFQLPDGKLISVAAIHVCVD